MIIQKLKGTKASVIIKSDKVFNILRYLNSVFVFYRKLMGFLFLSDYACAVSRRLPTSPCSITFGTCVCMFFFYPHDKLFSAY